ncbi:MAG: TonB-dependent receptor [Bacteroidota bacterium]
MQRKRWAGLWAAFSLLAMPLTGQTIMGYITDEADTPLVGATVRLAAGVGSITDADGHFELEVARLPDSLYISYIGYQTNTSYLTVPPVGNMYVQLLEGSQLETVEVRERQRGNFTSTLAARNVESITSTELRKAPCCNLGESFETNATVDVSYADPLTGSREIQLMGLRGAYSELLVEKRPALNGLAAPLALDYIPGTWLESIQIGKGAGSVQSTPYGMTGSINNELKKPMNEPPVFINAYASHRGRGELNIHLAQPIDENWSHGLFLHGGFRQNRHDHDFDRFQDMTDVKAAIGMYRLFYRGPAWEGQLNVHGILDRRSGGQTSVHNHGQPILEPYRMEQDNRRIELSGKMGFIGFPQSYKSMGFIWQLASHELDNIYGLNLHQASQRSAYANWLYQTIIGTTDHQLTLGVVGQFDRYDEQYAEVDYSRDNRQLGAYLEHSWIRESLATDDAGSTVITTSLRLDRHNLADWQFTPRLNAKFNLTEKRVLRLTAGRGWRVPQLPSDLLRWLPSSRTFSVQGAPQVESSWNYGVNLTSHLQLAGREGSITLDLYRTDFQNQLIIDADSEIERLLLYNLEGRSYAQVAILGVTFEPLDRLEIKMAGKINDAWQTYQDGVTRRVPLTPEYRLLVAADLNLRRWRFNAHWQYIGPQRLPDHSQIPETVFVAHPQVSPSYGLLSGQVTYRHRDDVEFYFGVDNATNFRQSNAIIGSFGPFEDYFDATQIYAPIMGSRIYSGVRWTID